MTPRPADVQEFLDTALAAFAARVADPRAAASLARIGAALQRPGTVSAEPGARLPVCDLLEGVADPERFEAPDLRRVVRAFAVIEPRLVWRRRGGDRPNASGNFLDGHANALITGPGGLERRADVWLGVSLMAPHVRYPDHTHPPEETYLVLSEGEFRHGASGWFSPGPGGTLYNEPGIGHAMRSGAEPLLAFWALWAGSGAIRG
ncbi:MAG: dimethylsulfoniopropionate lyase [Roseovarius sp.]|nr:dimethylsulfoniopropionate lyase [Roseovarius sp.]